MKKKILILNGQYVPGYKGGGPIQSCVNMIENLSEEYDFYVLTSDRDYKAKTPYDDVKVNDWNQVGSAKVYYMSPDRQTFKGFEQVMNTINYDLLYLNGFFSPIFTFKPLILSRKGKLKNRKTILTPRGDFTGGCKNKKIKKYSYIYMSKITKLYKGLLWHATSTLEEEDILEKFKNVDTFVVPNLPAKYVAKSPTLSKCIGELRLVFISRIFPKKNLRFALEVLSKITNGKITFDIYGPMEDELYWEECKTIINKMPQNICVEYRGEVPHSEIANIFEQYHAFFFPTLGENYGHVIVESIMNNCITILSAAVTPWDDYHNNGGFVIPLNQIQAFVNCIRDLCEMTQDEYSELQKKNAHYICNKVVHEDNIKKYIELFE